jgi:hypothetical protein
MIEVLKQAAEDVSKAYDVLAFAHTERALELLAKTRTSLRQAIREHAMYEVQRLGQEIEQSSDYERGFIDGMQKQMQSSVDKAVNAMSQRTWVGLTDEEENEYNYLGPDMHWVIQEIEAKLKEKNT